MTEQYFAFEQILTDADIIQRAKDISKYSAEISKIEEEKKKLPHLRNWIRDLSKEIEDGKIEKRCLGRFSWHDPIDGWVSITPVYAGSFPPFSREMTPEEMAEHSQIELPFGEKAEKLIVESMKEIGFTANRIEEDEDDLREIFAKEPAKENYPYSIGDTISPLLPFGIKKTNEDGSTETLEYFKTREEAEQYLEANYPLEAKG